LLYAIILLVTVVCLQNTSLLHTGISTGVARESVFLVVILPSDELTVSGTPTV